LVLASISGCRVHAVDGYEPFIREGNRNARRRRLDHLVTFEHADLEQWGPGRSYDAAMMLGLWPLATAARALRSCVKPRGLYLIDDVYYDPARGPVPRGLSRPPLLSQCAATIRRLGDTIVDIRTFRPSEVAAINRRLFVSLERNAAALGESHPRLRASLREFLSRQRHANEVLATSLRPALWLVQRGRSG
jgi:hypothetical protein